MIGEQKGRRRRKRKQCISEVGGRIVPVAWRVTQWDAEAIRTKGRAATCVNFPLTGTPGIAFSF